MIEGERIILRAWERDDLPVFTRWLNDPEVTVYVGRPFPNLSLEQETAFYDETLEENGYRYVIVVKESGVMVGTCSFYHRDERNRAVEVGIIIGEKDYWSQGYGREALKLMLKIGFEGLGMNRIWLRHVDFNGRGHRAYEAAGFREEARMRQSVWVNGAMRDDVFMSVLAEEYWAQRGQ